MGILERTVRDAPWILGHLIRAERSCRSRGRRLTAKRKELLALLLAHGGGIKAYELLQQLRQVNPNAGPPAVYRPLQFLMESGLVHRVELLNAYVACRSPAEHGMPGFMLVCSNCSSVREINDESASRSLAGRLQHSGYSLQGTMIEVSAICPVCAAHC